MSGVVLFTGPHYQLPMHVVTTTVALLPPPFLHAAASILVSEPAGWVALFSRVGFAGDELWIECPVHERHLDRLRSLDLLISASGRRWGKRIASVQFSEVLRGRAGARTILDARGDLVTR